jgi:hypothetical protein
MDETVFYVKKREEGVIEEGIQTVHNVTNAEKEEHVTIPGACSSKGRFIPQVFLLKNMYRKTLASARLLDVKFI